MLSLQPAAHTVPKLVIAIGNPSRGDDALGPLAAQRIAALGRDDVEVLTDFQLQIEHALDLLGRRCVVFIDASVSVPPPFSFTEPQAARDASVSTHTLTPAAVLQCYCDLMGAAPPPAWVLAIRGEDFELGAPLSPSATAHLEAALAALESKLAA